MASSLVPTIAPSTPQDKCLLSDAIYDYTYVSQGRTKVPHPFLHLSHLPSSPKVDSIDDNEELQFTDAAFDIIGFSKTEKWSCYKVGLRWKVEIRVYVLKNPKILMQDHQIKN